MAALASVDTSETGSHGAINSRIAAALGLSADATADQLAEKIAALNAKAEGTEALMSGLQNVMKTLSAEITTARDQRIEAKVDAAISAGTATPALREFCITIANSSETLFDEFCTKMGKPFAYLMRPAISAEQEALLRSGRNATLATFNTEASRLAAQLGIKIDALL